MLALQYIRENKNSVLKGLEKMGFKSPKLIDQIIDLDQQRRSIQTKLDSHLSDSNKMAKEIGNLFKSGEIEKANTLKQKKLKVLKPNRILVLNKSIETRAKVILCPMVNAVTRIRIFFHCCIL